jgi:hypothetical protein
MAAPSVAATGATFTRLCPSLVEREQESNTERDRNAGQFQSEFYSAYRSEPAL